MPDAMGGLMGGGGMPQQGPPQQGGQQGVPPQAVAQIAQKLLQTIGPQGCAMLIQILSRALQGGGGAPQQPGM